jgi:hypothetical protein
MIVKQYRSTIPQERRRISENEIAMTPTQTIVHQDQTTADLPLAQVRKDRQELLALPLQGRRPTVQTVQEEL